MRSGYLLTSDYAEALRCFETTPSVRYAAGGTDGRGFAAFDVTDDELFEWDGLIATYGAENVFLGQVEANPDDPSTWPDWARRGGGIKCPKRGVATGNEIFVLVDGGAVFTDPDVTGLAIVTDGNDELFWLAEFDTPAFVAHQVWRLVTTEYADKRLVSA
jgi:hypothetical protein